MMSRQMMSTPMMSKLQSLPERALELAGHVGDGMKTMVRHGDTWLETGAKLGALKTGTRVATGFVRRHPAAIAATVAGAGLLWYLARRRAQRVENGNAQGDAVVDGKSRRIDARRSTRAQGRRNREASPEAGQAATS